MNLLFDGLAAPLVLVALAFFALTAVLWLLLPFSIFGIKAKLDEQLRVLRSLDDHLGRLQRTLTEALKPAEPAPGPGQIEVEAQEPPPPPEESGPGEVRPTIEAIRAGTGLEERWQKPGNS